MSWIPAGGGRPEDTGPLPVVADEPSPDPMGDLTSEPAHGEEPSDDEPTGTEGDDPAAAQTGARRHAAPPSRTRSALVAGGAVAAVSVGIIAMNVAAGSSDAPSSSAPPAAPPVAASSDAPTVDTPAAAVATPPASRAPAPRPAAPARTPPSPPRAAAQPTTALTTAPTTPPVSLPPPPQPPPSSATASAAAAAAPPGAPSVTVLNQTGVQGLAAAQAKRLQDAGWQVRRVTNVNARVSESTVYYDSGQQEAAARLAATMPSVTRALPRPRWLLRTGGLIVVVTRASV